MGITKILLTCLFIGIVMGALVSNLFRDFYINQFFLFDDNYLNKLSTGEFNQFIIFQMASVNHLKEFALLCLLTTTTLGIPAFLIHASYKGFCVGFLIATSAMRYGIQGVFFFIGYLFPHYLLLIPLYIILYLKGYEVNYKLYSKSEMARMKVVAYVPYLIIMVAMIVVASFLEAYVNSGLIRTIMLNLGS